jgi:hypothetical protein
LKDQNWYKSNGKFRRQNILRQQHSPYIFFLPYVSKNLRKINFEYLCTDTQDCQFLETIIAASHLKVIEEVSKCENLTMANRILHQAPVRSSSDRQGRV